jgi:acetyltransferase
MAADRAADLGIPLATLSTATLERLQSVLPPTWSHANPVDLIGDAGPERYRAAVSACLEDRGVDGVLAILSPQAMTDADGAAAAVIEAAKGSVKPVFACWMGGMSVSRAREAFSEADIPALRLPETGVEAFAHLAAFYRNQRLLLEAPPPLQALAPPDLAAARGLIRRALENHQTVLDAVESKDLLEAFGIPIARALRANDREEAASAAQQVGFPAVLKIDSPDISHKSDVGGVRLGLADKDAVRAAFDEMVRSVRAKRPEARIDGVSVERMMGGAHRRELMAGIVRDPVFGPAIAFGAGGIAVEVLHDRAVALPPLNAALVEEMVRGTRISKMLGEFRNLPAVDRAALEAVLLRCSEIACELPEVEQLDINPLMADERGVIALDARVVLREPVAGALPYSHLAIEPYPADLVRPITLADGTPALMRPIRPEDAAIEGAFVENLSAHSRRMRFQGGVKSLTPRMLARFTQIDYDREMAFIATVRDGERERQVAVGRYTTLPDRTTCEYAIVIGGEVQGRGLGRLMMLQLIEAARRRGLKTMMGLVLADNTAMLKLCQQLGFKVRPEPGDPSIRRVELDLAASEEEARAVPA